MIKLRGSKNPNLCNRRIKSLAQCNKELGNRVPMEMVYLRDLQELSGTFEDFRKMVPISRGEVESLLSLYRSVKRGGAVNGAPLLPGPHLSDAKAVLQRLNLLTKDVA